METNAMPFELREFMAKAWKRHRDVPTTIDQLVDRAVEDLDRRRKDLTLRMRRNPIKVEPLVKLKISCNTALRSRQICPTTVVHAFNS